MGLGKTMQVLHYCNRHLPAHRPIVIVCPKTILENWRREARLHIGARTTILEKTKPPKGGLKVKQTRIYAINYEILGNPRKKRGTWLKWLKRLRPVAVVIDECHRIKSLSAICTKAVRELCKGVKHVIAISGTPLTSRPAELWSSINIVRPDVFPQFMPFGMRYCGGRRTPWGWDFRGSAKLKELHRILSTTCMIRRLKKDVLTELPAKTRHVVKVQMERHKEYVEAERDFVKWLKKKSHKLAQRARKTAELVKIGYLKRLAAELKLKAVFEWIDNYLASTDEKLLVFGVHKAILHALLKRYSKIAVLVDGGVTGDKRQSAIDKFNRDKTTRLMFGNILAAGVGWSCTSTSNVLKVELDWVPGNHRQAEDRVHGLGRGVAGKAVTVWYLVAAGSIEERICKILEGKQGVLDSALDGNKKLKSLDIHRMLERQYMMGKAA